VTRAGSEKEMGPTRPAFLFIQERTSLLVLLSRDSQAIDGSERLAPQKQVNQTLIESAASILQFAK